MSIGGWNIAQRRVKRLFINITSLLILFFQVGFQLTHLIDDGKTLVLDELRVDKKTERKEVQNAVLKYINETSDPNVRLSATGVDVVLMTNHEMGFYGTDQWNLITKRVSNCDLIYTHELQRVQDYGNEGSSCPRYYGNLIYIYSYLSLLFKSFVRSIPKKWYLYFNTFLLIVCEWLVTVRWISPWILFMFSNIFQLAFKHIIYVYVRTW